MKLLDIISGDPKDFVEYIKPVQGTLFIGKTKDEYYSLFVQLDDKHCVCTRTGLWLEDDKMCKYVESITVNKISCRSILDDDTKLVKVFDIPYYLDKEVMCIIVNELLRENHSTLHIIMED